MSKLANLEKKMIGGGTNVAKHLVATAIEALSDYKDRHLGGEAASVSFYAIFSVFPLLAFSVYLVGSLIGDETHTHSTPMVLKMLRDFVPAMQTWIEKGIVDVLNGHSATNWMNAVLLGWSGLGLFGELLGAVAALPEGHEHGHRAHITEFFLALATFGLFALFLTTLVFCEMAGKSSKIPFWLETLPFEVQDALFLGARTRILLGVMSVGIVMTLYKLLTPVKLSLRSALIGAITFTGLLLLSRSVYWIYLHYHRHEIESSFGIFSQLILIMLWVHFSISCFLFGGLFALHLDRAREAARGHGAHGGGHEESHDEQHGGHKHAA